MALINGITMKFLLIIISLGTFSSYAKEGQYIFVKPEKKFTKLFSVSQKTYLVTSTNISEITKKGLQEKIPFNFVCNDACLLTGNIVLATDSGIMNYSVKNHSLNKLLPEKLSQKVDHVITDASNHLWFSSMFGGAYMIDSADNILEKVKAPAIYSLAATPDKNVWVGTNIGLYKIPLSGAEINRYEEEGIEGYEISDNLVEKLFADENSNIWALLDGITVFIPNKEVDDVPSYNYVGDKNNKVLSIVKIPASSESYLFATARGIIYAGDFNGYKNIHTGEIHQTYHETAYLLPENILEKPLQFKNDTIINIANANGYTWFITENGLWKLSTKKLVKNLKKTYNNVLPAANTGSKQ